MIRAFALPLSLDADGRNVLGRIFPFNTVAHIKERNKLGELEEYDEEFLPGCTERMRQVARARGGSPAWIRFTLDHESGFDHRVGYCTTMQETPDGVDCAFRLYDDPVHIDKVRSMLAESHNGLSIEFDDVRPPITNGDLRQRKQIHISAVTATPIPVYGGARVLAMRGDSYEDALASAGTPNLDRVRAMLADIPAPAPG